MSDSELRELAAGAALAEERERRRISMVLHDRVGHGLALAALKLDRLREAVRSGPEARAIDEVQELVTDAIAATRSLTFELSSPLLYELGLGAALEGLAEQAEQRYRIPFDFETDALPAVRAREAQVVLYRAVRELVYNVGQHARARRASVSVQRIGSRLRIGVEDDGVGFEAASPGHRFGPSGGFGLFSIREQLRHLGGLLEVDSAPGEGTRACVIVTLDCVLGEAG